MSRFFTEYAKKPGIALFLDFRKAFDTIEWAHLKTALHMFNFDPDMLSWFQIIYNQVSSCVLRNGHASEFFLLGRRLGKVAPCQAFFSLSELNFLPEYQRH